MKKILIICQLFVFSGISTFAQNALNGSGKMVHKEFAFSGFNKIKLDDLAGEVTVEAGNVFSIKADIDDNLEQLLSVSKSKNSLIIGFRGNKDNALYIEKANIKITIVMPSISFAENNGNSNLRVTGLTGSSFELVNSGNGDAVLSGKITEVEIRKNGNGNVDAKSLVAEKATVKASGNGDVVVNASKEFNATGSGNGDIMNVGLALASSKSLKTGNGKIRDASNIQPPQIVKKSAKKVPVAVTKIQNILPYAVRFRVMYYPSGTYGFTINPGETHSESFPVGTKIYRKGSDTPTIEITEANIGTLITID